MRAVTRLGGALGMYTTAEGVETPEQLERVRAEGCTEMQGFLFTAPRVAAEIGMFFTRAERVTDAAQGGERRATERLSGISFP